MVTITGTNGDDTLGGTPSVDTILGSDGTDSIDGGTGNDGLKFVLSDTTLFAAPTQSRTYTFAANGLHDNSGHINTTYTGIDTATLDLRGFAFGDTVDASAFTPGPEGPPPGSFNSVLTLDLGAGNNIVTGSAYADTVRVGNGINIVDAGAGRDMVYFTYDVTHGGTLYLTTSNSAVIGTLNGVVVDTITNAEQILVGDQGDIGGGQSIDASGMATSIIMFDSAGNDVFVGSHYADSFANGFDMSGGTDLYTGNGGADTFDFTVGAQGLDGTTITDFDSDDVIDLSFNDPATNPGTVLVNHYIGSADFTGTAGEYRSYFGDGKTYVQIDTNGDRTADGMLTIANGNLALVEVPNDVGDHKLMMDAAINRVTGTDQSESLSGALGNDIISALGGSDIISGSDGSDSVDGGTGFDSFNFVLSNAALFAAPTQSRSYTITADSIHDASGHINTGYTGVESLTFDARAFSFGDTVDASIFAPAHGTAPSLAQPALTVYLGDGNDTVTGSAYADRLWVGSGINTVDAGLGEDSVYFTYDVTHGGTLYLTMSNDTVIGTLNGVVVDTIANAERLLIGAQGDIGGGQSIDASGLTVSSIFFDSVGNDVLIGSHFDDIFADGLNLSGGTDVYTGNGGADTFDFTTGAEGLGGTTITDFDSDDVIDLNINDPATLPGTVLIDHYIGSADFSGIAGEYRSYADSGKTYVQYDANGDGAADGTLTIANGEFKLAEVGNDAGPHALMIAPTVDDTVHNDFNGDGRSDILWRNDGGALSNWLGKANGGFSINDANAYRLVSNYWHVAGTGDFNGDGRSDIVWRNNDGRMSDWLSNANGGFDPNDTNAMSQVETNWHIAGTGDFNGDGRDDILWRRDSGELSDWLGKANGGFALNDGAALSSVPTEWHVVGTGDFDGDGRDDILWRSDSGAVSDWLGKPDGGFANNDVAAFSEVPASWHVAGTGDFNGDGRDDILWRNDDGKMSDWLGEANGGFTANDGAAMNQVPTSWHIADTGDFNGDGRADILWRSDDGKTSDWLGKADGGFTANDAAAMTQVPNEWHIQGHDFFVG